MIGEFSNYNRVIDSYGFTSFERIVREDNFAVAERAIRKNERRATLNKYGNAVLSRFCAYCDQSACDGGMMGSMQECETIRMLRDVCTDVANEMSE